MMRRRLLLAFLALALGGAPALPAQSRLEGQALSPLDEPVPGARVEAEHDGLVVARTFTDAQGLFVLPSVPSEYVVVHAYGPGPDVGAAVADLLGEGRGFVRLRLMPARKVAGTVRDADGKPVAGAAVFASPSDDERIGRVSCNATTDGEGRYELTHVASGPAHLRAWCAGQCCAVDTIDGNDDLVHDLAFPAQEPAEIVFELADATAAQANGATLRVTAAHGRVPVPLPAELARPQPTAPGKWVVRGWARDDEVRAWITVPGAFTHLAEQVVLPDSTSKRRVFYVDEGIRGALAHAPETGRIDLLVQPVPGANDQDRLDNGTRRIVTTAADGTFVVPNVTFGNGLFAMRSLSTKTVLRGNNRNSVWFLATGMEPPTTVDVRPAHTIALRLRNGAGEAVVGAEVEIDIGDTLIGVGSSDLEGRVAIESLGLAPGAPFRCTAVSPQGFVSVDATAADAGTTLLGDLAIAPAAILDVVVMRSSKPVPAARILLQSPREYQNVRVLVADRDGHVRCTGLLPGDYRAIVKGGNIETRVTMVAGTTTHANL